MYYPYLRGKQYELIALREFSQEIPDNQYICPIIEPVKSNLKSLQNAVDILRDNGMEFVLILNPNEGDFKHNNVDLLSNIAGLDHRNKWKPALLYTNNSSFLRDFISKNDLENVVIIFKDGIDFVQDDHLEEFLTSEKERIFAIVNGAADTRASKHILDHIGIPVIRLDDKFNNQKRNVDYTLIQEEPFTEEPFYYQEDGFIGFSDYTTLPKNFVEGGMMPYAIAIHITFRGREDIIYIRHFVSDTNETQENIQGKFAEAGRKVIKFFSEHPDYYKGEAIADLNSYVHNGKYPGLGMIKKISVKHHLELISNILGERYEH